MSRFNMFAVMLLASVFSVAGELAPVSAQHDAAWKALGQPSNHQGFSRRMTHAADYSRDLRTYASPPVTRSPVAVKEVASELGRNLEGAKKHLADMKKEAGDDKATLVAIEKIEAHLATAFEHHKMAQDCCSTENFDAIKVMSCCKDLTKEIEAIIVEHNALMKSIAAKSSPSKAIK